MIIDLAGETRVVVVKMSRKFSGTFFYEIIFFVGPKVQDC